ncbi:MAG: MBL fold metallo-hydrolase [Candidatus Electryonea clarkiae]|nr:MBL fold metallo-hydrolase [Candidatus Electryonea clarkiae]MDP8286669.1 MBL fold metallo-hydrolase [Candidatus Electryonea clarkiae]
MKITFYGTRGSIPVPEKGSLHVGGNTSSTLIEFESGEIAILDAGTGIRKIGHDLMLRSKPLPEEILIGLSHTHWDHIQGFPFFSPAYNPKQKLTVAICRQDYDTGDLESVFRTQMQSDFFPLPLEKMGAEISFWQPHITRYRTTSKIKIEAIKHNHPGNAYTYRIEEKDSVLVYCTDIEHGDSIDERIVELSKDADLLIHDAQYTPDELENKKGWGHSSWEQAVEVAMRANVKKLALFHHDPDHDDKFLINLEWGCQNLFPSSFLAREGMEILI